jgi:hypothetical protein
VSGFRTAVLKPVALMAGGGGGIYATVLIFKYDFDGCEFSEVRKEISVYLSVTVCRSVLKLKLALVAGSAATSMERNNADAIADADEILLWKTKKVRCHVRKSPSLIPVLIHMYPVHTLLPYFFEIHFNIILQTTPWPVKCWFPFGLSDQHFVHTVCTRANSLHVGVVKYLINKNYGILIFINIKNCT